MSNNNTTYGYFRVKVHPQFAMEYGGNNVFGYMCVRLDRPEKENQGVGSYKASFSFCSPHDVKQFTKPMARKIADARMNTTRIQAHVEFENSEQCPKLAVLLRKAIDRGLNYTGTKFPDWFDEQNVIAGLKD